MKGKVEVYAIVNGEEEILYEESNLVVDTAGQTIVDMLSTPSSTLGISPRVMDTSNWVVQAVSFGKDSSAYSINAHRMPERRNMVTYSTPSAPDTQDRWNTQYDITVYSNPDIKPPPAYAHVASSIAHVVTLEDRTNKRNGLLTYTDQSSNPSKWTLGAFNDMWITVSMYVKHPVGRTTSYRNSDTLGYVATHFGMNIKGAGYDAVSDFGGSGFSRLGTIIRWDEDSKWTTPSAIDMQYAVTNGIHNVDRMVSAGYSEFWQQNGGVSYEGDGWYRVWITGLAPMVEVSSIGMSVYPTRWETDPSGESQGGTHTYGFQVEPGRWPTDLQFNNGFYANNWDWSGSVLASENLSNNTVSGTGTVRVSGSVGVSSYVPTNSLARYPDPLDKKLARTSIGDFAASTSTLSGLDMGQNLNVIAYRRTYGADNGTASEYMKCAKGVMANWKDQETWRTNLRTDVSVSGFDALGPQAYFLGCYPEGSSTGGTRWAIVSDLDSSAAYGVSGEGSIASGVYNSGYNEASSMDISGFVGKVYNPPDPGSPQGNLGPDGNGVALSAYALTVSSSVPGQVTYQTTVFSGDVGMSQLYGGIYCMGLWTPDMEATLKHGPPPPFVFSPLDNPIKYRLFSVKKFNSNLAHIHDNGAVAGSVNYSDLKIRWTLDFRSGE